MAALVLFIKTLLQFQQKFRAQVVKLGLGLHQQQNNFPTGKSVEVNPPCAASLAHTLSAPTHLAQTARTKDDIASQRVVGNPINELPALRVTLRPS
jgi:hypothetical protein